MKRSLEFSSPLVNVAGSLGFSPVPRAELPPLGAFITNPLSWRPRLPAAEPACLAFEGGFLLHTGLPNPGFAEALRRHARHWREMRLPVIVHLMADRPEEAGQMASALEDVENVMALELGFAPRLSGDILLLALEMCRGELPLIVNLSEEQLFTLGARCLGEGAAALSLASPRGALPLPGGGSQTGRLFGPALFPRTLLIVREAARAGFPLIASGGVYSQSQVNALLEAGALAVGLDAVLWQRGFTR